MYKIIMTHNRPWTKRELLLFIVLFVLVTSVLVRLFKKKRIVLSQVFAGELLFIYIMIAVSYTHLDFERYYDSVIWNEWCGNCNFNYSNRNEFRLFVFDSKDA